MTYHQATAPPRAFAPSLRGETRADVCVIGAGLTGLTAATRLAERGARVVLLEAKSVGAGASGVSGGQIIPGLRHGAAELIRRFGVARARGLVDLTYAARTDMVARIGARAIACDLRLTGHLTAAAFDGDLPDLEHEASALATLGIAGVTPLDRAGLCAHVASDRYHGGLFDAAGGHVHPLAYARGLADAAVAAGVAFHEDTPALAVEPGPSARVAVPAGVVMADDVLLGCDAGIGRLRPALGRRLMPVWSYSVATQPLGDLAALLLPSNAAVSDTRFALDYYRRSADGRLLFSGGERYTLAPLADIAGFVRPHLARAFPALAGVAIEHAWAGTVAVTTTRFPHVGRTGPLWWAGGYSGHGVLLAQAAGRAVADAMLGDRAAFDLLAALPTRAWPGGAMLRRPLYTAGMVYYAARDRLRGSPPPEVPR